jgi:probable rRNA maturation factor
VRIEVFNNQTSQALSLRAVKALVKAVIAFEGQSCDEVTLHFVETDEICRLHEQFFGDPSTTDCISFPMDDCEDGIGPCVLGEVFVCPATAVEYAKTHHGDSNHECTLYIVHGLLHLMGYDDIDDADIVEMRAAEERHMQNLKQLNLILKHRAK